MQQTPATVASVPSGTSKLAVAYKYNNMQAALNNTLGATTASANMPVVSRLSFGQYGGNTNYLDGIFRKATYYPFRGSATVLQSLSQ